MERPLKKKQKMVKGMPTAVLLSILIHAGLFLLAGVFVVFTVVKSKEVEFEPPKAVERPKMKLKKPKVKVKKSSKPRPTTRIVTKVQKASMPDIQLPEMSGMTEGLAGGIGGFDIIPDLNEVSVFGSGQTIGNDFVGTFYDFKRDFKGRPIPFSGDEYMDATRRFIKSGWKVSTWSRYYKSARKRYATTFVMPPLISALVPGAFGEPETVGCYWSTLYKGKLVCPASHTNGITFRFMGGGDGTMAVRVDGKMVLVSGWLRTADGYWWDSTTGDDLKYLMGNRWAAAGDWITLEPGDSKNMEVMMVEGGGVGCFILAIDEKGVEYPDRKIGQGPTFPAFKTAEPTHDLLDAIYCGLVPGEISLTNGPVFCDYDTRAIKIVATNKTGNLSEATPPPQSQSTPTLRVWTSKGGKTLSAEYIMVIGNKVVLKTENGKQKKILIAELSPKDREYLELASPPKFNIDFSASASAVSRILNPNTGETATVARDYQANIRLKQTSAGKYNHNLHVEFFAIGKEISGKRYVLLDRGENNFVPTEKNTCDIEFKGKEVEIPDFYIFKSNSMQHRGLKPAGYLIIISDERGEIIQHQASNPWLWEHLENLRKLPVGAYMDKNCVRTFPTPPPPVDLENIW